MSRGPQRLLGCASALFSIFISLCSARAEVTQAPPLYAFDNGLTDVVSFADKAALLKELGYAGICWSPKDTTQMLAALDQHDLEMCSLYVPLTVDATSAIIPPEVVAEINCLKGRKTIVFLMIMGKSSDSIVIPAIQHFADIAAENGLTLVLYPHFSAFTDTERECLRLARVADRPNIGVSFNLCHFLAQSDPADLEATVREMADLLKCVTINGAEGQGIPDLLNGKLIQPLGMGSFDLKRLLTVLEEIHYHGPVGLQCYNIPLPARQHLTASMQEWKKLTAPM